MELDREIRKGEIIKMEIKGKMRLGKSTLGIALGIVIHKMIKKHHKDLAHNKGEFNMNNIARDEQEWSVKMREFNRIHDIIVTDEKNKMLGSGLNATVEQKQREVFSDEQASRYIHGIFISPQEELDANADIKLEVRNRDKGFIHTRVFYKLQRDWILLGIADFDVKELISNWQKIEKEFYLWKSNNNEELGQKIKEWTKKDFYVYYMIKKHEKQDLMNKEHILNPRELDYAEVYWDLLKRCMKIVNAMPVNAFKNTVMSMVKPTYDKYGLPSSILGINDTIQVVIGMSMVYLTIEQNRTSREILKMKLNKGKIDKEQYNEKLEAIYESEKELIKIRNEQENRLLKNLELKKKYNMIGEYAL